VWCKTDEKLSGQPFLITTGVNMVIDNPDSINEVVNAVTGDELDTTFTDQSNNYHI
jgi:hypothetical protein